MTRAARLAAQQRLADCRLYAYFCRTEIEAFVRRARSMGGTEEAIRRAVQRMIDKALKR